jgi:hypothetical protein
MFRFLKKHLQAIYKEICKKALTEEWRKNQGINMFLLKKHLMMIPNEINPIINEVPIIKFSCVWPKCFTVVLFTFLLSVTQRYLQRRCNSRHVTSHSTAMTWICEVWSCIAKHILGFYTTPTHNMIFPLRWWYIKFEITASWQNIPLSIIYSAQVIMHAAGRYTDQH